MCFARSQPIQRNMQCLLFGAWLTGLISSPTRSPADSLISFLFMMQCGGLLYSFGGHIYRYCQHPQVFTSVACTQAYGVELMPRISTVDSHACPLGGTDVVILVLGILAVLTCANHHG